MIYTLLYTYRCAPMKSTRKRTKRNVRMWFFSFPVCRPRGWVYDRLASEEKGKKVVRFVFSRRKKSQKV